MSALSVSSLGTSAGYGRPCPSTTLTNRPKVFATRCKQRFASIHHHDYDVVELPSAGPAFASAPSGAARPGGRRSSAPTQWVHWTDSSVDALLQGCSPGGVRRTPNDSDGDCVFSSVLSLVGLMHEAPPPDLARGLRTTVARHPPAYSTVAALSRSSIEAITGADMYSELLSHIGAAGRDVNITALFVLAAWFGGYFSVMVCSGNAARPAMRTMPPVPSMRYELQRSARDPHAPSSYRFLGNLLLRQGPSGSWHCEALRSRLGPARPTLQSPGDPGPDGARASTSASPAAPSTWTSSVTRPLVPTSGWKCTVHVPGVRDASASESPASSQHAASSHTVV